MASNAVYELAEVDANGRRKFVAPKPLAILENGKKVWGYNKVGQPICNSPKRGRPGQRCQSTATFPNGRCEDHGGKNLRGPAHPNFHTGKFSNLPGHLGTKITRLAGRGDLLDLSEQIAMFQAILEERMAEICRGWDTGFVKQAIELSLVILGVGGKGSVGNATAQLNAAKKLAQKVIDREKVIGQIGDAIEIGEHVRKGTESQIKALAIGRLMVKQDELDATLALLDTIMLEEVGDPKVVMRVWDRLTQHRQRAQTAVSQIQAETKLLKSATTGGPVSLP